MLGLLDSVATRCESGSPLTLTANSTTKLSMIRAAIVALNRRILIEEPTSAESPISPC